MRAPHTVHADALAAPSDCRKQRRNSQISLLTEHVKRHGAVFPATPAKTAPVQSLVPFFALLSFSHRIGTSFRPALPSLRRITQRILVRLVERDSAARTNGHASSDLINCSQGQISRNRRVFSPSPRKSLSVRCPVK